MSLNNGTICDKHNEIDSLADEIRKVVKLALNDGQRMEDALYRYKETIKALEKENELLKERISDLEYELEYSLKKIKELEKETNDESE
jgi:predicted  nucleic acid-binding Zn-ribbon protein